LAAVAGRPESAERLYLAAAEGVTLRIGGGCQMAEGSGMTDSRGRALGTRSPGTPILIGIAIVVVLAIIIALALSERGIEHFEAGSPEATAQAYIQALFDDDFDEAYGYLSDDLQAGCRRADLSAPGLEDTATFEEVRRDGDHAEIELRLGEADFFPGDFPFDNYDWSRRTELELDRIDGVWRVTFAAWPVFRCRGS
jgi:hypothetical protein